MAETSEQPTIPPLDEAYAHARKAYGLMPSVIVAWFTFRSVKLALDAIFFVGPGILLGFVVGWLVQTKGVRVVRGSTRPRLVH